jgi:hypothetical protein
MACPPEGASPRSPSDLAAKAAEVVARWKARLRNEVLPRRGGHRDSKDANNAAAQLRAELVALETEVAAIEQTSSDIWARAETCEQRAMRAIKAGDDQSARRALMEQQTHVERATPLEADLTVLRALAAECRFALNTVDSDELRGPEAR